MSLRKKSFHVEKKKTLYEIDSITKLLFPIFFILSSCVPSEFFFLKIWSKFFAWSIAQFHSFFFFWTWKRNMHQNVSFTCFNWRSILSFGYLLFISWNFTVTRWKNSWSEVIWFLHFVSHINCLQPCRRLWQPNIHHLEADAWFITKKSP